MLHHKSPCDHVSETGRPESYALSVITELAYPSASCLRNKADATDQSAACSASVLLPALAEIALFFNIDTSFSYHVFSLLFYHFSIPLNAFCIPARFTSSDGWQYVSIVISTPAWPRMEETVFTSTFFSTICVAKVCLRQ